MFNVHGSVHRNNILVYKSQQDVYVFINWGLTAMVKGMGCHIYHVIPFSGKAEGLWINSTLLICGLSQDVTQ